MATELVFTALLGVLSLAPGDVAWVDPTYALCGFPTTNDATVALLSVPGTASETLMVYTNGWSLPENFTADNTTLEIEALAGLSANSLRFTSVAMAGVTFPGFTNRFLPYDTYGTVSDTLPGNALGLVNINGHNVSLQVERVGDLAIARVRCVRARVWGHYPPPPTTGATTGVTTGATTGVTTGATTGATTGFAQATTSTSISSTSGTNTGTTGTSTSGTSASGTTGATTGATSTTSTTNIPQTTGATVPLTSDSSSVPDPAANTAIALVFLFCFSCCFACTATAFFTRAGRRPVHVFADVYQEVNVDTMTLEDHPVLLRDCAEDLADTRKRSAMALFHDNLLPVASFPEPGKVAYYIGEDNPRPWREAHSDKIMQHFNVLCGVGMGLSYLHRNQFYHGHLTIDAVLVGPNGAVLSAWGSGTLGKHPWREVEWRADADPLGPPRPTENSDLWDLGWLVWQMFTNGRAPCASWDDRADFLKRVTERPGEVFLEMDGNFPPDLADLCMQEWHGTPGARPVAGAFVVQVERMAGFTPRGEVQFH